MKFVLQPSLEHMALVQIGISSWNQNDVRAVVSKFSSGNLNPSEWQKIEERIVEKVSQLSLPQLLKEKVLGVIKPIGLEIFECMQYYCKYEFWIDFKCYLDFDFPAHLLAKLCWTPQGTVDWKRTAEVLVGDVTVSRNRRYKLACDHCLEDDIIRIWNSLPVAFKKYDWSTLPVIQFWSDTMRRERVGPVSYKELFYSSVRDSRNKVAAKYFLQQLTPQEKQESLKDLAKDTHVLCYLMLELDSEQQMEVFRNNPDKVLHSFLKWPLQSFFIEAANCMWDFLSADRFDRLLTDIVCKNEKGYKDWNYQKLFKEFWQKSPIVLKNLFIDEIDKSYLLPSLFYIKDKENIRLILKDTTLTVKEKLIYGDKIKSCVTFSIQENEWDFLDFFIRECLPSKDEMLKFKEELEKRMFFKECSAKKKHKWNQLFYSSASDDSICKNGKRGVEEGDNSSSKRFQSLQ